MKISQDIRVDSLAIQKKITLALKRSAVVLVVPSAVAMWHN